MTTMNPLAASPKTQPRSAAQEARQTGLTTVSIVIPCLNEEDSLPQLAQKLRALQELEHDRLSLEIVLVDDGSTDRTVALIDELLSPGFRYRICKHAVNQGIGAAIVTGIQASTGDVIVTIDADCTFDPLDIPALLRQLQDGVSVVIGSPYHPEGTVDHVPAWRIMLSRTCSRMYKTLFRNKVDCYTGCFRAFRAGAVRQFRVENPGFVGVVELLWKLDGQPGRFVEVPVQLSNRKFGKSKMKTLRAMFLHMVLMIRIATGTISRRLKTKS